MKNVTVTMSEALFSRARVQAAREGKSLSKFVAEAVEGRVGRVLSQKEALDIFLNGPLMDLTDEHGRAPSRDKLNE
jgi:hypothetical protein